MVDQPVAQHRGPDRAILSVQLPDPVSCDLVGLHLGPLDQQAELRIDLLHGGPKLEGDFIPLLLVSAETPQLARPPFVQVWRSSHNACLDHLMYLLGELVDGGDHLRLLLQLLLRQRSELFQRRHGKRQCENQPRSATMRVQCSQCDAHLSQN